MKTDLEKLKLIQSFITENYVELETSRMLHKTVKNKAEEYYTRGDPHSYSVREKIL